MEWTIDTDHQRVELGCLDVGEVYLPPDESGPCIVLQTESSFYWYKNLGKGRVYQQSNLDQLVQPLVMTSAYFKPGRED